MTRRFTLAIVLLVAFTTAAFAGTTEGKVSSGNSVVYVDSIPGKTFPDSTKDPLIDQKGLKFNPTVLVVQQGTTVDFQNDDTVQHNVFWPSISGNKKEATTSVLGPKVKSAPSNSTSRASCLCCAMCTPKWQATSSSVPGHTSLRPMPTETLRSRTSLMANTTSWPGTKA